MNENPSSATALAKVQRIENRNCLLSVLRKAGEIEASTPRFVSAIAELTKLAKAKAGGVLSEDKAPDLYRCYKQSLVTVTNGARTHKH